MNIFFPLPIHKNDILIKEILWERLKKSVLLKEPQSNQEANMDDTTSQATHLMMKDAVYGTWHQHVTVEIASITPSSK